MAPDRRDLSAAGPVAEAPAGGGPGTPPAGPPLSVAITAPGWPPDAVPNGVIPYVDKVAGSLRAQGHRATVLAASVVGEVDGDSVRDLGPGGLAEGRVARGLDAIAYRISGDLGMRRQAVRSIVRACRALIADRGLQVLEMEEAFGLPHWVRRGLPIPVVVRLHGPWFLNGAFYPQDERSRAKVRAEGLAIASADSVTSPSLDALERTRAFYGLALEGAKVIANPTAMVAEADRWTPQGAEPGLILFVGRFDLHKGGDLMIRAFAEVAGRVPDARLRFVGPDRGVDDGGGGRVGIEEFIRREAPAASGRVEYLGPLPNSELGRHRREARVSVVCSRYETFGMTLTEAMAHGCPTVATRAGAFPEIVQDGVNGLLASPDDPADLAARICDLLGGGDLPARLGRRAALDVEGRYEAGRIGRELAEHYRGVIAARKRAGIGLS